MKVERLIDAPVARVWSALTDRAQLKEVSLGADVVSDWMVGSPIAMSGELGGKPWEEKGAVLANEPERLLRFSHWSALSDHPDTAAGAPEVTVELTQRGQQTLVELTGDEQGAGDEASGSSLLAGLARVVEAPAAVTAR